MANIFVTDSLFSLLFVLLTIAFFTLVERKVIGLSHYRKGPRKIFLAGLAQPVSDATKLLAKEISKFEFVNSTLIKIGPLVRV